MTRQPGDRMIRFASLGDLGTARIVAARLVAEGIPTRLHGEALGPYALTVGPMAHTELWIPESRLEEARLVMLEAEIDLSVDPTGGGDESPARGAPAAAVWVAVAAAVLVTVLIRLVL